MLRPGSGRGRSDTAETGVGQGAEKRRLAKDEEGGLLLLGDGGRRLGAGQDQTTQEAHKGLLGPGQHLDLGVGAAGMNRQEEPVGREWYATTTQLQQD